jgi:hypothetical protein
MATDGRWTRKRGRRRAAEDSGSNERSRRERVIAVFGYNNQLGIGRRHGFIRTVAVRAAAAPDGHQLGALLDRPNTASPIWADRAYRSAANVALLARRGLVAQVPRPKPRGRDLPAHRARGNASRARVPGPPAPCGVCQRPTFHRPLSLELGPAQDGGVLVRPWVRRVEFGLLDTRRMRQE